MFDYLIVGAGLFGAVCARELTDAGKRVLVIEKSDHIGGMCYTKEIDGITTQVHGGHIFHTNDKRLWDYVNRYACWRQYSHRVKAHYKGVVYSFPINLMTLQQVFENVYPAIAEEIGESTPEGDNLKDWCISQIGVRLYERLIEGYTWKQWGKDPAELPAGIIKRIPVRMNWDDAYFSDEYQGLPVGGYQPLFENLLKGIRVEFGKDYCSKRTYYDSLAYATIYSGPIDLLYGGFIGKLDYRSLRFETERIERADYQGCPTMNYTEREIPYTRIHEHKHWYPAPGTKHTIITREYPAAYDGSNEPYYPINDAENTRLYKLYRKHAEREKNLIVGGRMGTYRYLDMHMVLAQALSIVNQVL